MHALADLTTTDAAGIATTLLAQLEDAWNRADGPTFGEPFAPEADFVDIRGDHHRSRTVIAHGHQAIFDSIYAGSTVRYELESARSVAPGVVVAVGAATLEVPAGPMQGHSRSRLTLTIVEGSGRWEVAAFQNTVRQA